MTKYITTFADFEVDTNDNAIGFESANRIEEPEYPISEDDAANFTEKEKQFFVDGNCYQPPETTDELDYAALREAEIDEAYHNLALAAQQGKN